MKTKKEKRKKENRKVKAKAKTEEGDLGGIWPIYGGLFSAFCAAPQIGNAASR
jgi:hypothetical protein